MILKACPFCGHTIDTSDGDTLHPSTVGWIDSLVESIRIYTSFREVPEENRCWEINCSEVSGGCGAQMVGDGKEEVMEKWNKRVK